jgi:lysophospholipid acyltransferase (LPLAT)-like uncharacterized protein
MKIRSPWLIKPLAYASSWVLRGWIGTLRYEYRPLGPSLDPAHDDLPRRYIYAMWHENMLLPAYHYSSPDFCVLISKHGDAQLFADMLGFLKVQVIRGSTNRGGVEAVRGLLKAGRT